MQPPDAFYAFNSVCRKLAVRSTGRPKNERRTRPILAGRYPESIFSLPTIELSVLCAPDAFYAHRTRQTQSSGRVPRFQGSRPLRIQLGISLSSELRFQRSWAR
jgi:hypothetical protein